MEIVDSQVHIWGPDTPERPWRAGGHAHAQRAVPVSAEEVVGWMDEGGISAAIIVPPSWEGDRNDLAIAAVRRYPGRFAVMGRVDPDSPELRERLPGWRDQPGMLGIRLALHTPQLRQPFIEGRYDWMWADLERLGIPVMVLIHHPYMHMIDAIAAKHPRLRFVIDHLGLVNGEKDDVAFRGLDSLLALGKRANDPKTSARAKAAIIDSVPKVQKLINAYADSIKPNVDSAIKYNNLMLNLPARVSFTEFTPGDGKVTLGGSVQNQTEAARPFTLKIEFLDKAGQVVNTQTVEVPAVGPKQAKAFKTEGVGAGIVAFRYAPIT